MTERWLAVAVAGRIDLSKPRYDQSTYGGRLQHYFEVTDPRTVLASDAGTPLLRTSEPPNPDANHSTPHLNCAGTRAEPDTPLATQPGARVSLTPHRRVFADLDKAASLVKAYNAGTEPKGTSADDVWAAKKLSDPNPPPSTLSAQR